MMMGTRISRLVGLGGGNSASSGGGNSSSAFSSNKVEPLNHHQQIPYGNDVITKIVPSSSTLPAASTTHSIELGNQQKSSPSEALATADFSALVGMTSVIQESLELSEQFCTLIAEQAEHDDSKRISMDEIGICPVLVSVMSKWRRSKRIVLPGCIAIAFLSRNEQIGASLGQNGASELVVSVLNMFGANDKEIARWGCWAISNLACNDYNQRRIGEAEGCFRIVETLRTWRTDSNVVLECCWAILNVITQNKPNTAEMGLCGVCPVLIDVMRMWAHNHRDIAIKSCKAIIGLSIDTTNQTRLADAGACQEVLHVIRTWEKDADVMTYACWAVSNLSDNYGNQLLLGEYRACEKLVTIIQAFRSERKVLERACTAIVNLAKTESNEAKLISSGACELVIEFLTELIRSGQGRKPVGNGEADLCLDLVKALLNLSFLDQGKRRIISNRGCEIVVEAMRTCSSNQGLVEHAIRILLNLALSSPNAIHVGECGGVEETVAAMWLWIHDRSVVYYGLRALVHMCSPSVAYQNRTVAGERDAWKQAITLLRVYPTDESVVRFALQLVSCLCQDAESKSRFRLFRGIHTVVETVGKMGRSSRGVTRAGVAAVLNLALQNRHNREELFQADAIDVAVHALTVFESDSNISYYSCSAVFYLYEGFTLRSLKTIYPQMYNAPMFQWLLVMLALLSARQVPRLSRGTSSSSTASAARSLSKFVKGGGRSVKQGHSDDLCWFSLLPKELIMIVARTLPSPLSAS